MIEGDCPQCGAHYIGWALLRLQHQTCIKCGAKLTIIPDGQQVNHVKRLPLITKRIITILNTPIPPNNRENKGQKQDENENT